VGGLLVRARACVVSALVTGLVSAGLVLPGPAEAGTTPAPRAAFARAVQQRDGSIDVRGWSYDRRDPSRTQPVCLVVNGRCVRVLRPHEASPAFDRLHHLRGPHRFDVTLAPRRPGIRLELRTVADPAVRLATTRAISPGARIVAVAKKYLGARYVEGGSSPRGGFDCSGYSAFSYAQGRVATLPHNAQAQRFAPHMHRISRAHALPGDLVFYLSGGSAYHVAVYAGHGYQYAAATPRDGVRYQPIWSRAVEFRTDWH
jgi:hypothetical protein